MMPGIVTPLTGSLFGRAVDRATSVRIMIYDTPFLTLSFLIFLYLNVS